MDRPVDDLPDAAGVHLVQGFPATAQDLLPEHVLRPPGGDPPKARQVKGLPVHVDVPGAPVDVDFRGFLSPVLNEPGRGDSLFHGLIGGLPVDPALTGHLFQRFEEIYVHRSSILGSNKSWARVT